MKILYVKKYEYTEIEKKYISDKVRVAVRPFVDSPEEIKLCNALLNDRILMEHQYDNVMEMLELVKGRIANNILELEKANIQESTANPTSELYLQRVSTLSRALIGSYKGHLAMIEEVIVLLGQETADEYDDALSEYLAD